MKIAIFSKIPLFPPHRGNRVRILNLCKVLEGFGCKICYFLLHSRQLREADIEQHIAFFGYDSFHIIERSPLQIGLFNIKVIFYIILDHMANWLNLRKRLHNNVDYLYSNVFNRLIRRFVCGADFDIAIVEYVHFSRILEEIPNSTFKLIDTHDSFHNEFMSEAETKGFMRANKIIAIQDEEADFFRSQLKGESDRVHVVSHLLNVEECMDLSFTKGVAFLGASFSANICSLRYFIDDVLPLVLKEMPQFKLFVAGSIVSDIANHSSIIKLGHVPLISDAFRSSPILINPVREGTGVKTKLLDAMALGVPTISTTSGVRGLRAEFLEGVVTVADDDPSAFSEQVLRLVREQDLRITLGKRAYAAAQKWNDEQRTRLKSLLDEARAFRQLQGVI